MHVRPPSVDPPTGPLADAVAPRIAFREGEPYSPDALAATQRALYQLGRFSTVVVAPQRVPGQTVIPVKITVALGSRHEIRLGGGFGLDSAAYEARVRGGFSLVPLANPLWTFAGDARVAATMLHKNFELDTSARRCPTSRSSRSGSPRSAFTSPSAASPSRPRGLEWRHRRGGRGGHPERDRSYTLDRWITAAGQARHAPITGGLVEIPGMPEAGDATAAALLEVRALLAVLGRTDLAAGTVRGRVAVGGTLGTPTAEGRIELAGLVPARRAPGRPAPAPTDLDEDARWDGAAGRVTITGQSGAGTRGAGTLTATAEAAPADLTKLRGSLTATGFDLAPIAAFLPGELAAVEGTLRGNLAVSGLGSVAQLRGDLELSGAVIPTHARAGTLRDATARARITDAGLELDARGALGRGKITLAARSPGHDLATVEATARLDDVSPLGVWEPVIDADVTAKLDRAGDRWTGEIRISNGSVVLPPSGSELGDAHPPRDLLSVEDGPNHAPRSAAGGRPPDQPWLVADVDLRPTKIRAEDLFDSRGTIRGKLQLLVGDTIGLFGRVDLDSGIVGDLFGRRYDAAGTVAFDGTLEPKVDLASSTGSRRSRSPCCSRAARARSSPTSGPIRRRTRGISSPASSSAGSRAAIRREQTREAATGAGAAVLSSALGARIRKRLPIRIEQLGCDPGNSVTTASCTVGRWFGEKLFVAFKRRIETQQAETVNANEVQGQYYLRRDLYFEMVGGDAGSGGLDLLWRRRW